MGLGRYKVLGMNTIFQQTIDKKTIWSLLRFHGQFFFQRRPVLKETGGRAE